MFILRDQMWASQIMQQRMRECPNIKIYWNTVVEEILGDNMVDGVRISNTTNGKTETVRVNGFFVAIGHEPNSAIFKGWLDMDETGYIKTVPGKYENKYGRRICSRRCTGQDLPAGCYRSGQRMYGCA